MSGVLSNLTSTSSIVAHATSRSRDSLMRWEDHVTIMSRVFLQPSLGPQGRIRKTVPISVWPPSLVWFLRKLGVASTPGLTCRRRFSASSTSQRRHGLTQGRKARSHTYRQLQEEDTGPSSRQAYYSTAGFKCPATGGRDEESPSTAKLNSETDSSQKHVNFADCHHSIDQFEGL